jgi:Kef-type K+ transport system membrane component KefB
VILGRFTFGVLLIAWAGAIFACGYLAVVNDEDKTRAALVGLAGTLGAGFAAVLAAAANAWRTGKLQDVRDARDRLRIRGEKVLELASRYDSHRRRAYHHQEDFDSAEEGDKAALNALAWQETDAATGIRDDLISAIELARQEASEGNSLVATLAEIESQLRRHERWIPTDHIDELPLDALRKAIADDLAWKR